jgi:hypothetical protein
MRPHGSESQRPSKLFRRVTVFQQNRLLRFAPFSFLLTMSGFRNPLPCRSDPGRLRQVSVAHKAALESIHRHRSMAVPDPAAFSIGCLWRSSFCNEFRFLFATYRRRNYFPFPNRGERCGRCGQGTFSVRLFPRKRRILKRRSKGRDAA